MEKHHYDLLHLLRCGLQRPTPAEAAGRTGADGPTDWKAIYETAVRQGVLALVWDGVQREFADGRIAQNDLPPRALKLRWACNVARIEARYALQRSVIARLASLYAEHGIRTMILKGYGLSLLYPRPEHRPCGDIDIWLFGRQREADRILRQETGIQIDADKHHHTTFDFDGVPVENHYDFINVHSHRSNREIERQLKELAQQTPGRSVEIEGATIQLPPVDFDALFLLRHAAAHFAAAEIALRHVIDWALFVAEHHARIDWQRLERTARQQHMLRFLHCLNAIAIDRLGLGAETVPAFERDPRLEKRVWEDILSPGFAGALPRRFAARTLFRLRRWWGNRWKHRLVYREGLVASFFMQLHGHLAKPDAR